MKDCKTCKHLDTCESLNMPKEVIAFVIDLIEKNSDDTVIDAAVLNQFGRTIDSYGYSTKMLKKYLLELEDDCIEQRK